MRKFIVTLQTDFEGDNGKMVTSFSEIFESENIKTSIHEVEYVDLNENQHIELIWDKEKKEVIAKAVDNPKTREEELSERIEAQAKAIETLIELVGEE